ncbi:MAG: Wzz/FepE/Etk N-terminal domain-containing protein [Candidatus Pacebacteria bacterium]|nr:Wzz/FepE/Etk N-terminal domain-containing protein [Candidatus Paceibacterota bacterium]
MNEFNYQKQDKEIDLASYIKILIKEKKIIFIFFLIGLLSGGLIAILSPRLYKAETYLEVGKIYEEKNVVAPSQLAEKINSGFYGLEKIKAHNFESTDLVKIEAYSGNPQDAKDILKATNEMILKRHNNILEHRRDLLADLAKELENKIDNLNKNNKDTVMLEIKLYEIKKEMSLIEPTSVIIEPKITSAPGFISTIFSVFFGALAGLLLSFFAVSFKTWWKNNKISLQQS